LSGLPITTYNLYSALGLLGEEERVLRVVRALAVAVTVLGISAGLTLGFFLPASARADDTTPTTVPTPTIPTPDPAPPKPKPTAKPAPKPAPKPSPTRQVSHTPTYRPPVEPSPTVHAQIKPKPTTVLHKTVRHKKVVVTKKKATTTSLPTPTIAPVGAVGVRAALRTKSDEPFNLRSLLVVLGLSLAIGCFAVAIVPVTYVRWRPAAIFVSERQVDLTVIGLGLLVVIVFALFLTGGP
jgi:hypothetical protein